ncbi:hypothetical protein AB4Z22_22070, partial [Paenibacillus sp. TAF58]
SDATPSIGTTMSMIPSRNEIKSSFEYTEATTFLYIVSYVFNLSLVESFDEKTLLLSARSIIQNILCLLLHPSLIILS